jgi:PAS domain S-box-containing protein
VNGAFERLYGYRREEVIGSHISVVRPRGDRANVLEEIRASTIRGDWSGELWNRRKDGSEFPIYLSTAGVRDERGRPEALTGVTTDITERRRAGEAIERAKLEAEKANRAKTEFLAHMSHEIRTPLNGIIGMTELLLERCRDQETRDFVLTIRNSGGALRQIINDILDFSRIEAGRMDLVPKPFNLEEVIREVASLMAANARRKGLELLVDLPPLPRLSGDAGRFRQIVFNLVGNAIKFTERGHIRIAAVRLPEENGVPRFSVAVEDTGIGIPPGKLRSLFVEFTQVDSSPTRRHDGTGLGLAISRRLAVLMGGDITVTSAPGRGSTFTCTLPLALAPEAEPRPSGGASAAAVPIPRIGAGRRVLLVEDNTVNQKLGVLLLQRFGCTVDVASDGRQALQLLAEHPYDLVFMDCSMPVMDGYAATSELRRREGAARRTPVIAMTAHATAEARRQCLAAGMDDYLSKPVDLDELADALRKWLGNRQTRASATSHPDVVL